MLLLLFINEDYFVVIHKIKIFFVLQLFATKIFYFVKRTIKIGYRPILLPPPMKFS